MCLRSFLNKVDCWLNDWKQENFIGKFHVGSYVLTFEDSGNANKISVIQQDMQPHLFCNLVIFPLSIKKMDSSRERSSFVHWVLSEYSYFTPFAVHYDKIRNHLLEKATNSAKTFISAKIRTFEHKLDLITIFASQSTFNNTFGHSYASFGIQKRKIYFH